MASGPETTELQTILEDIHRELSPRFGGWELSGDVVIYDEEVFEWVCAHPGEADRIAWERLRDGTRDIWA